MRSSLSLAALLAWAGPARADDLFTRLAPGRPVAAAIAVQPNPASIDGPPAAATADRATAEQLTDEPADEPADDAAEPVRFEGYDLANYFGGLAAGRGIPAIAVSVATEDHAEAGGAAGCCDFPGLVAEAQRTGAIHGNLGVGSVADRLPGGQEAHGNQFAGIPGRGNRRMHPKGSRAMPCPPVVPESTLPPSDPAMRPSDPTVPPSDSTVPPSDLAPVTPAVPNLEQALPPARALARADIGGLGSGIGRTPNLLGDGGAPSMTAGRISLGRIMISASGLNSNLSGSQPAVTNLVTDPQFNDIQSIRAAGYPTFIIPQQSLGLVAGTPPVSLPGSAGVETIDDPGPIYQSAAQNAFIDNPDLPGTENQPGTATFVKEASGSLPNDGTQDAFLFYDYIVDSSITFPGLAVGFIKLTENMSPLPRNRAYMNYSYFRNANFYGVRGDVNRFMPGFEKTFIDGWTSIEIRTPFAATLDNTQDIFFPGAGAPAELSEYRDIEFGNMSVIFKTLLIEGDTWAFTGGAQVMLPTANNTFVNGPTAAGGSVQQVFVANESVHMMPFLGAIWAPNERFFSQALLQIDRDVNGNLAYVNGLQRPGITGRSLQQAGRIYFPTFMYASFGSGYWVYKNDRERFTGFSPVLELHVNQAFEDFTPLQFQQYQLGQNPGVVSVTNALVGCNLEWGTRSTLSFAYVTPLGSGVDRFFDGELRAVYNWRFGPQNRLTRAQF